MATKKRSKKAAPVAPTVEAPEQRAEDQDAAVEQAFVAGVLPEEDRREPEAPAVEPVVEAEPPIPTGIRSRADDLRALQQRGPGA